jgi:hypothetical protein
MTATPSWPPLPAFLGPRRREDVFRSLDLQGEGGAIALRFIDERRTPPPHRCLGRGAIVPSRPAGATSTGTGVSWWSYSSRWMRSAAEATNSLDALPRLGGWSGIWTSGVLAAGQAAVRVVRGGHEPERINLDIERPASRHRTTASAPPRSPRCAPRPAGTRAERGNTCVVPWSRVRTWISPWIFGRLAYLVEIPGAVDWS